MKSPLYLLIFVVVAFGFGISDSKPKKVVRYGNNFMAAVLKERLYRLSFNEKIPTTERNLLQQFYRLNGFKPVWLNQNLTNNAIADSLIQIIKHANYFGLQSKDYDLDYLIQLKEDLETPNSNVNQDQTAILFEILLSKTYMHFGKHLNYGKVENTEGLTHLQRKKYNLDMPNYFANAVIKDSVFAYLYNLQPKQKAYIKLQKMVQQFVKNASLSDKEIIVPDFRKDSVNVIIKAKLALVNHLYLSDITSEQEYIEALKLFQKNHGLTPDGIVGKNTASALSVSPLTYYQNAAISLERWRWKENWQSSYIHVNIPSYNMEYVQNDSLILQSRVVVGRTKNRTPEIYSKLSYLVAYPYWHVPKSISVKEILVKAKEDSSYMQKNNYQMFTKNLEEIALDSVRWDTLNRKNFNFYIRQKGGSSNALGLVKFIFNNNYSIYLHDTPSKSYFKRDIRAYSHGCVRVEKAMDLTNDLLMEENNKFTIDSVHTYIAKREEKKIMLQQKLPIYIQYITCTSEKGRLIFYKDIYGYDEPIRKVMFD